MPNENIQTNNYTLTKLIRTGISPLLAMIGTSAYYGQKIGNPILGSINALLFSKKLGIDIWDINQMPSTKKKILNSSKKILLGLGTIGLANYTKFTNDVINPIEPTTTPIPITTTSTIAPITTSSTTPIPITTTSTIAPITTSSTTPSTTTTTLNPFPTEFLLMNNNSNRDNNILMDWDTYISLNTYGIANLVAGLTELIPNRFENVRKIANMLTGSSLIGIGVAMGINNDFTNTYAVPNIIAGASEIIHNLLPIETTCNNNEMQETRFTNDTARLINGNVNNYGSNNSIDSLTSDVIYERRPVYQSTTVSM